MNSNYLDLSDLIKQAAASNSKKASPKKVKSDARKATEVAAGTTGALAATKALKEEIVDRVENAKVRKTRSIKDLKKKLKPGDILFTRYDPKHSPDWDFDVPKNLQKYVKGKKNIKLPIKASEFVQFGAGGSTHYHGALYVGGGRALEAEGQAYKSKINSLKEVVKGNDVKVYRVTNQPKSEITKGVNWAKKQKGVRYGTMPELLRHGAGHLFGRGGPKSCRTPKGKGKPIVCTTTITKAHPKTFKREYMSPDEMRAKKGVKLVARFGRTPPTRVKSKILQRVVYPVLKKGKWGALAGAATYLGAKGKKKYDKSPEAQKRVKKFKNKVGIK